MEKQICFSFEINDNIKNLFWQILQKTVIGGSMKTFSNALGSVIFKTGRVIFSPRLLAATHGCHWQEFKELKCFSTEATFLKLRSPAKLRAGTCVKIKLSCSSNFLWIGLEKTTISFYGHKTGSPKLYWQWKFKQAKPNRLWHANSWCNVLRDFLEQLMPKDSKSRLK